MTRVAHHLAVALALAHAAVAPLAAQTPDPPDVVADPQGHWGFGASAERPAVAAATADPAALDEGDCWGFDPTTFCGTGYGWQWFGTRVPGGVMTFRAWSNLFNVPEPCPLSFTFDFGDGTSQLAPGTSINASTYVQVTHKFAAAGTYPIRVTASNGYKTISCTMVTITIYSCWQDGVLCYRGDNVVWNRPYGSTYGKLTMDPPISVNQTLRATGPSRIEYWYNASGTCTRSVFTPTGDVFVPLADSNKVLFAGSTPLDVSWTKGEMLPLPGAPASYGFTLGGLPLLAAELPLVVGTDSVTIQPYSWIGIPDVLDLCKMSTEILLPRDGTETLLKAQIVSGQMTPSITFVNVAMSYDPNTQALDVKTAAKIPFSKWLVGESGYSLDAQWGFKPCGLNRAKVTIGGIKWNIPLGGYPPAWFVLNDFIGELDHVCDAEGFLIGLGGRGNLCVGPTFATCVAVPGEFFRIADMVLAYQYPFRFILRGGTPQVLGYPIAGARAVFNFGNHPLGMHVDGWMNVGGILQGAAGVGVSLTRLALLGQLEGSLAIPDFGCARTSYACRALKSAVASLAGGLPRKLQGVSATIDGEVAAGSMLYTGSFRGTTTLGPLSLAFQVSVDASGTGLLIGTDYANMIDLNPFATVSATRAAAVEHQVTLATAKRNVIFSATSTTTTMPSLSLRTPAGATITAANVGSFPGVQAIAHAPEATAGFLVGDAAAGAWTMSVGNLAAGQVAFAALTQQPPPALTLTTASLAGDSLTATAQVSPPRSQTTVTFLLATAPTGGVVEPIGAPLPATSGTVNLSWNASELASGAYYVGARADDGMSPPVTVFHAQPVVVDRGTLAAPTSLSGSRDGAAVTLTWTPSESAGAVGTTVLYTDRPDLPGYPFADSGTTAAGITIGGLDPASEYAFAAVAYDAEGNQSAPSAPWTTSPAAPPAATPLPPGATISDATTGGTMRMYFVRVPAGATALTVATTGASANLALYLRHQDPPTESVYDYRAGTATWDESLTVTPASAPTALAAGDWYIGVSATGAATYAVTADITSASPCALWCSASVPASAAAGAEVSLIASPTLDGCAGPPTFDWDFGDGSAHSGTPSPSHAWTDDGVYDWILTVTTDGRSCISSGSIKVGLGDPAPVRRQLRGRPAPPPAP